MQDKDYYLRKRVLLNSGVKLFMPVRVVEVIHRRATGVSNLPVHKKEDVTNIEMKTSLTRKVSCPRFIYKRGTVSPISLKIQPRNTPQFTSLTRIDPQHQKYTSSL